MFACLCLQRTACMRARVWRGSSLYARVPVGWSAGSHQEKKKVKKKAMLAVTTTVKPSSLPCLLDA